MWPLARQIGSLTCRIVAQGGKSSLPAFTQNNACVTNTGTRAEERTQQDCRKRKSLTNVRRQTRTTNNRHSRKKRANLTRLCNDMQIINSNNQASTQAAKQQPDKHTVRQWQANLCKNIHMVREANTRYMGREASTRVCTSRQPYWHLSGRLQVC